MPVRESVLWLAAVLFLTAAQLAFYTFYPLEGIRAAMRGSR